jgi:hypothetical protein
MPRGRDVHRNSRIPVDVSGPRGNGRPRRGVIIEIGAERGAGFVVALRREADLMIAAWDAAEAAVL